MEIIVKEPQNQMNWPFIALKPCHQHIHQELNAEIITFHITTE